MGMRTEGSRLGPADGGTPPGREPGGVRRPTRTADVSGPTGRRGLRRPERSLDVTDHNDHEVKTRDERPDDLAVEHTALALLARQDELLLDLFAQLADVRGPSVEGSRRLRKAGQGSDPASGRPGSGGD